MPLPIKKGNGHPVLSKIFSCKLRKNEPFGFGNGLEKTECSPNEKVGTKSEPCFRAFFTKEICELIYNG